MKILSLSICLIIALAVFVGLGMALTGCSREEWEKRQTEMKSEQAKGAIENDLLIIDSCEYFKCPVHYGSVLVHKGNCKNCRKFYTELHGATP